MAPGDTAAHTLYYTFDVGGVNQVVDADFILEGAQETVQAVEPVLTGSGPVFANLDDDFLFDVAARVVGVLQPVLRSVKVAFERSGPQPIISIIQASSLSATEKVSPSEQ